MRIPQRPRLTALAGWWAGPTPARRLLAALIWAGAGLGIGYALRFLAIEPATIGRTCTALEAPPWCSPRQAVIWLFHLNVIGGVAAAAGLLALAGNRRDALRGFARLIHARRVALAMGGLALVLYNVGLGAAAVALGLLAAMDER